MTKTKMMIAGLAAFGFTAGGAASAFAQSDDEGGEASAEVSAEASAEVTATGDGEATTTAVSTDDAAAVTASMPIVTPKGKLMVHVGLGIGLSKELGPGFGGAGKPIAITPDIWYGVAPKLEVGLAHSGAALDGFWGDSTPLGLTGRGVCVSGDDGGCVSVYNGPIGLLAGYELANDGKLALAADVGVIVRAIDSNGSADGGDLLLGVKLGVRGRYTMDKISIGFAPNIGIGLTSRDGGNKEELAVPVDVMFAANEKLGVGLQTGIEGPLDGFGDSWSLPIGIGALYGVNDNIGVGGAFILHRVTGGGDNAPDAADLRSLQLFLNYHN